MELVRSHRTAEPRRGALAEEHLGSALNGLSFDGSSTVGSHSMSEGGDFMTRCAAERCYCCD